MLQQDDLPAWKRNLNPLSPVVEAVVVKVCYVTTRRLTCLEKELESLVPCSGGSGGEGDEHVREGRPEVVSG